MGTMVLQMRQKVLARPTPVPRWGQGRPRECRRRERHTSSYHDESCLSGDQTRGLANGVRDSLLLGERDGTCKAKIARLRGNLGVAEEEDTCDERRHAQGSPSANPLLLYYPATEDGSRNPTD
jgi:hypothetical protein